MDVFHCNLFILWLPKVKLLQKIHDFPNNHFLWQDPYLDKMESCQENGWLYFEIEQTRENDSFPICVNKVLKVTGFIKSGMF